MSSSNMTPLCGFGMVEGDGDASPISRQMQSASPTEGATITVAEVDSDWVLLLSPATNLQMVTVALPSGGSELQIGRIASMLDIANTSFTGGTVLNAPMELLANQAVTMQCIDRQNNIWITI